MFWENYKGSTDLLTRWVYPPIVWPLVRLCTRLGIHPNAVTLVSIGFTIAAVPLFARGDWIAGFLCAYAMSVLDSVDGKVARVTLTDSKIGNILDHGIDQVHPPFWYFAWAWGLGAHTPADPLYQAALWLIFFYFADRIVLAVAKRRLGFALHAATRLDGRVRSLIARRNITMTIMAIALLLGQGPAGLYIVTAWQGLTFAWHAARTLLGFFTRVLRRLDDGVEVIAGSAAGRLDRFVGCRSAHARTQLLPPCCWTESALAEAESVFHSKPRTQLVPGARQGRGDHAHRQTGGTRRAARRMLAPKIGPRSSAPCSTLPKGGCGSAARSEYSGRSISPSTRRAACSWTASTPRRCS